MKKLGVIVLVSLFAIFAIADIVRDFIANDTVHYFVEQPHRLLFVAAIGIIGGMVCFLFYQLSPQLRRGVKLLTLGSAATFVTLAGGYFSYQSLRLSLALGYTLPLALLSICAVALLLWLEFYQVLRSRAL